MAQWGFLHALMEHIGKVGDSAVECGRFLINHNTFFMGYLFEVSCVLMVTDCSLIKRETIWMTTVTLKYDHDGRFEKVILEIKHC